MADRVSFGFLILFALSLSRIPAFADDQSVGKESVLTLDNSNFSDVVSKHHFIVVEFYAPWCGHCKKLAPEYEKAASILSLNDPPIVLAKVDANDALNNELTSRYWIQGFPTIKIFRKGGKSTRDYKGPRNAYGIVSYLQKETGAESIKIQSAEAAAGLIGDNKVVFVGVFPKFSGEEFENFIALAQKLRSDYEFGHTSDAKVLPKGESSVRGPLIRIFKPFDELFVDFQDFRLEALEKFVQGASIPLVTVFNKDPSNHPHVTKFFNSPNAKAMLFIEFTSEEADAFKSIYREAAEEFKGYGLNFLVVDVEASQGTFQYFEIREDQIPLVIIQQNDGKKFLKQNLEGADQIRTWLKEYKEGKLEPYTKSEPVPEVNNAPVKMVVADTLQDMVFKSGKNVFLEFYAPWCGHCKKLALILDEVAVSYENDADVLIAKLDATANDIPSDIFDVRGYPDLYFRSAGGKISKYDGHRHRTKEAIIKFINDNRDKPVVQEMGKDEL